MSALPDEIAQLNRQLMTKLLVIVVCRTFVVRFDGPTAKITAYTSGPFMSRVIGPPDGPIVFGSCFVRSGLIFSQLCPPFVVFHRCCDEA